MALRARNILSLCAGVGGLELGILLALHARGENGRGVAYVEREGAAAASLVASMEAGWLHPAPVWSNMLTFDARPWRGLVHILASGDPCQDNSVAGKRAGAAGKRFLAPEVCRLAEECRPDLIFRENVPGNADGQLEAIVQPLERLGYRVAAGIFSSAETGNTMRRERLFIMACACGVGRQQDAGSALGDEGPDEGRCPQLDHEPASSSADVARTPSERRGEAGRGSGGPEEPPCGPGGALERTEGIGRGEGRPEPTREQGRCAAPGSGGELGESVRSVDGWLPTDAGRRSIRRIVADRAGRTRIQDLPPAVIPGPTDSRWIDVLDRWPELQPALSKEEAESHLRRSIDAMAHRIERLRATGNGVDPVVAAYAFLSLDALLACERRTA